MDSISNSSHEVSIFDESGSSGNLECVGTIISSYFILTVASCLYGKGQTKLMIKTKGGNGQKSDSNLEEEKIRNISRIIFHPGFKETSAKYDLAILVLDQDLDINLNSTANILPVLNMSMSNARLDENPSKSINFSGFSCGQDSELSSFEFSQPQKCPYSSYKSDKLCILPIDADSNFNFNYTNSSGAKSNCSALLPGSSLLCSDEERGPFLCGIFAFSLQFMGENAKIYTNVTHHLKWIESVSAQAKAKVNESQNPEENDEDVDYKELDDIYGLGAIIFQGVDAHDPIPYQLSIQFQEDPQANTWRHICGSVILDKTTAITAAHCFDTKRWRNLSRLVVVAGEQHLHDASDEEQRSRIRKIIIHPNYTSFRNGSDIAILHIQELAFHAKVHAAWPSPFSAEKLINRTAVISGWGRTSSVPTDADSLQMGKITIQPPSDCNQTLEHGFKGVNVREGVVCALSPATRTCQGDSGGPLVIQNYKQGDAIGNLLVGITSFGPSICTNSDKPGVFTEISHFYDWIQENRAKKPCEENQSPCLFAGCYYDDWRCDAARDCRDGMDEMNCLGQTTATARSGFSKQDPFMKLVVTLNLPHSVMKHESFDLQVNVHNNLGYDVNVWVTIFNKQNRSDFTFVDSREQRNEVGSRYIKADKNHESIAHFVITPVVTGKVPIQIKVVAEDGTAEDQTIHYINVKPEGVRQTRSQFVMFNRTKAEEVDANLTRLKSFEVKFPEQKVKGGTSLRLTVTGDPMGLMLSNLDNLVNLPLSNGAQNMIKLVPNILALEYISVSAVNFDAHIVQRAKKNLRRSCAHQLQYQKPDGSFSIYVSETGSTWLTAYALRWFVEAQKFIKIDPGVITNATDFIRSKQREDGSFVESGPKYHPEMYSESGSSVALSAFITLTLIKANQTSNYDLNLTNTINDGMNFISRITVYKLDDNYITNLVTATLIAGNHSDKDHFFEKMEEAANTTITKDGVRLKYWGMKNSTEWASDPLAIEVTSYALLAHVWKQGKMDDSALSIQKWIIKQRNPKGGFISTQDTAMGLTALTAFAVKTKANVRNEHELQLNIQASSNSSTVSNSDTEFTVSVARRNRMVLQEFSLPESTKVVNVSARGSGSALIQLTESWHVPVKSKTKKFQVTYFNITASMVPFKNFSTEVDLNVCVNSLGANGVDHAIASVELPSGYEFYPSDYEEDSWFMENRPENVQRLEVSDGSSKVDIIYSSIPQDPPVCITLAATRKQEVANAKKAAVLVYEYANPEVHGITTYRPFHQTNVCQLCETTYACDQKGCL